MTDTYYQDSATGAVHFLSASDLSAISAGVIRSPIAETWAVITQSQAHEIINPSPTIEQILSAYQQSAQIALNKADITAIRIGEAVTLGLNSWTNPDVIAWTNYRRALRAQLSASAPGTLPTKPAYPSGT